MFYPINYQLQPLYYFPCEWYFPIQTINQNLIKVQQQQEPIQTEISHSQPQELPESTLKTQKKVSQASSIEQDNAQDPSPIKKPKKQRIQSLKKNTQTNILSQVFSFLLTPSRSQKQVQYYLGTDNHQKIKTFYAYMKSLKKLKSKYLNKKFLLRLVFLPDKSVENRIIVRSNYRNAKLTIQELRKVLYQLVFYFLRNLCISGVLESKRIRAMTIKAHLQKRRQFLQLIKKQAQKYF